MSDNPIIIGIARRQYNPPRMTKPVGISHPPQWGVESWISR
ncbi:hypothetical protein BURPS305_5093 [Burkholderia pseudomallei 305]|nr:hypothetical protein BURPS305_5093 [Burkholderia pseudomallei 305]KGC38591.1 hypothetical protein DO62_5806 [Burkholderia pseudomallei]